MEDIYFLSGKNMLFEYLNFLGDQRPFNIRCVVLGLKLIFKCKEFFFFFGISMSPNVSDVHSFGKIVPF